MFKNSIKCDNCGKELITDSQYPHKFTLELNVIDTNINTSETQFAIHMTPPFEDTKHFCNKYCLKEWL